MNFDPVGTVMAWLGAYGLLGLFAVAPGGALRPGRCRPMGCFWLSASPRPRARGRSRTRSSRPPREAYSAAPYASTPSGALGDACSRRLLNRAGRVFGMFADRIERWIVCFIETKQRWPSRSSSCRPSGYSPWRSRRFSGATHAASWPPRRPALRSGTACSSAPDTRPRIRSRRRTRPLSHWPLSAVCSLRRRPCSGSHDRFELAANPMPRPAGPDDGLEAARDRSRRRPRKSCSGSFSMKQQRTAEALGFFQAWLRNPLQRRRGRPIGTRTRQHHHLRNLAHTGPVIEVGTRHRRVRTRLDCSRRQRGRSRAHRVRVRVCCHAPIPLPESVRAPDGCRSPADGRPLRWPAGRRHR